MFEHDTRERDDGSVTLSNLSAPAVHAFLDFAYSAHIEIREDNVDMLFQLASFLQVRHEKQQLSTFISPHLDRCLITYDKSTVISYSMISAFVEASFQHMF